MDIETVSAPLQGRRFDLYTNFALLTLAVLGPGHTVIVKGVKRLTMIRAFIIEFSYNDKTEFANVVEYKHSPSVFYVTPVPKEHAQNIPALVLRQTKNSIEPADTNMPQDRILSAIVADKIKDYIAKNPLPEQTNHENSN